jgi:hypothetical protein
MRLDSVWLQPCMVPHWGARGSGGGEIVRERDKACCAAGTGTRWLCSHAGRRYSCGGSGNQELGRSWTHSEKRLRGKTVFTIVRWIPPKSGLSRLTAVVLTQRVTGASRAAKYGAVAVLVRSMNLKIDDFPHTGSVIYDSAYTRIPAAAISTKAAETLSAAIKAEKNLEVSVRMSCQTLPDAPSYNVIGEIRGSEHPGRFITMGGHLDSLGCGSWCTRRRCRYCSVYGCPQIIAAYWLQTAQHHTFCGVYE